MLLHTFFILKKLYNKGIHDKTKHLDTWNNYKTIHKSGKEEKEKEKWIIDWSLHIMDTTLNNSTQQFHVFCLIIAIRITRNN